MSNQPWLGPCHAGMPPTTGPITSSLRPLVQIEEHYHKLEVLNLEQLEQLLRQQLLQLPLLP